MLLKRKDGRILWRDDQRDFGIDFGKDTYPLWGEVRWDWKERWWDSRMDWVYRLVSIHFVSKVKLIHEK